MDLGYCPIPNCRADIGSGWFGILANIHADISESTWTFIPWLTHDTSKRWVLLGGLQTIIGWTITQMQNQGMSGHDRKFIADQVGLRSIRTSQNDWCTQPRPRGRWGWFSKSWVVIQWYCSRTWAEMRSDALIKSWLPTQGINAGLFPPTPLGRLKIIADTLRPFDHSSGSQGTVRQTICLRGYVGRSCLRDDRNGPAWQVRAIYLSMVFDQWSQ